MKYNKIDFITIQPKREKYYIDAIRVKDFKYDKSLIENANPDDWVLMFSGYPIVIPKNIFEETFIISLKAK